MASLSAERDHTAGEELFLYEHITLNLRFLQYEDQDQILNVQLIDPNTNARRPLIYGWIWIALWLQVTD